MRYGVRATRCRCRHQFLRRRLLRGRRGWCWPYWSAARECPSLFCPHASIGFTCRYLADLSQLRNDLLGQFFLSVWHRMPSFSFDTTRLSLWKWCRLRGAGQRRSTPVRKILVSEAKASGRSARKQRLRLGTEITHCRTAPAGSRDRLWCAAVCTMRRPLHDGQTPLPSLHENATTNP